MSLSIMSPRYCTDAGSTATGSSEPSSTEPADDDPAQQQPTPDHDSELVLETADFAEVVTAEHTCSDDESRNN